MEPLVFDEKDGRILVRANMLTPHLPDESATQQAAEIFRGIAPLIEGGGPYTAETALAIIDALDRILYTNDASWQGLSNALQQLANNLDP